MMMREGKTDPTRREGRIRNTTQKISMMKKSSLRWVESPNDRLYYVMLLFSDKIQCVKIKFLISKIHVEVFEVVENEINIPIIDCAEAAIKQAELACVMKKNINKNSNKKKLPPKISVGIDKILSDYLSHK